MYIYIYICRTVQLTSRRCILNIYSTNILAEHFKHASHSPFFFSSSRCRLFHNAIFFGSCNIHILNTECAKILKKLPALKGLIVTVFSFFPWVKRLGRKGDHLTSYNADARNEWSFGFTSHILLWRDKIKFPFTVILCVLLRFRIIFFFMNFLLLSIPSDPLDLMTCVIFGEIYVLLSF